MCGIVGYIGRGEAKEIVLDALKRLEYRGYDSAGIAILERDTIKVIKKKGKVDELKELVFMDAPSGTIGIGHTRWATHGIPSDQNAHPHRAYDIVVVHNGIIENYLELKEKLKRRGHRFLSDTDTEVIAHLVAFYLRQGNSFIDSVRFALSELKGSWAIALMRERERVLIGAKRESPLLVGLGQNEYFLASDAPAVISRTNRFIFLEDGDVVVLTDEGVKILNEKGEIVQRKIHTVNWSPMMAEKGGFKHFMLKEIYEQPRAISDTMIGRLKEERGEIHFEEWTWRKNKPIRRFWMVACGTSYHACLIGKYIFEKNLRIPVEVDIASEFRYREPPMDKDDLLILLSQSGETADTIAAMREGKKRGIYTLSICNVLGSTLSRESDGTIFTHAGPEIGVASTKSFVTQIVVLFMLMLHFSAILRTKTEEEVKNMILELRKIPHKVNEILERSSHIEEIAKKYYKYRDFLYIGRGINYPTILEGALKLKEISYIHAEGYAAGEMKHGPIALIDENMPVICLSPNDITYAKTCANIEEVISRRGKVILLTDTEYHDMAKKVNEVITIPQTIYELQPITGIVPLQLFAYYVANFLGTDVDQPRNLAKSVTVE
ncbi:MAG: glutamine--fructose-6-phosphate transaminase (isomerizing) [Desulfobacterota bacterium]|nr:glutamine--fructose-6-phosphate transaminase (isomerizing) [Thermodesulfobacteriota bacterium]